MTLCHVLEQRRSGIISPVSAKDRVRSDRLRRLSLNVDVEIISPHHGPVTWLDIDAPEERYLLTGGADCTIAVFDLDGSGQKEETLSNRGSAAARSYSGVSRGALARRRPKALREVGRTSRTPLSRRGQAGQQYGGHHHSVSVVRWYPVDTGLFVSGAMDGIVKLWDTNTLEVALEFDLKDKVFAAAMSAVPGQQHLIAVGNDSPQARLCDIRSGACTQILTGHSEAVWACAWSPRTSFLLATASADHSVRLWDIRRSGASACLISLDQHRNEEQNEAEVQEDYLRRYHEFTDLANTGGNSASRRGVSEGSNNGGSGSGGGGGGSGRSYMKHYKAAPHVSRVSNFACAHAGPVNSLCFTPDGLHLLSSGTDNRLRLWDMENGRNTMMNYLATKNRRRRPFGMVVAKPAGRRSEMVFYPNDVSGDVLAFPLHSHDGQPSGYLRAHFDPVQCCAYRPCTQELVTCGTDGLVLLWSASSLGLPSYPSSSEKTSGTQARLGRKQKVSEDVEDQDTWSSDEEAIVGRGDEHRSTSSGAIDVRSSGRQRPMPTSSTSRRGSSSGDSREPREGFVPPILMQERRRGRH